MSDKRLSEVSEEFHKMQNKEYSSRMVDWMITWHIGIVDEHKLWALIERAFPYKVTANEKYYSPRGYEKMGKWIDKNCTGMWTHSTMIYRFEFEEDAVAFKLRWS